MYRLVGLFLACVAVVGISFTHGDLAAQPAADKQLICHVSPEEGDHIIEVALPAVNDHVERHGDCLIGSTDRTLIDQPCDASDADGDNNCDVQP